jgi:Domain of unknown function (DUF4926)
MIKDYDRVVLTKSLLRFELVAGDVGTVVMVHERTKGYTVEFMTLNGTTVAVATVDAGFVRPIKDLEVTHARDVSRLPDHIV